MDPDKLEELFRSKFQSLWDSDPKDEEFWVNYCDDHKVLMLHPEWLKDTLNEGLGDKICIHNPEETVCDSCSPWLLVPRGFAERIMVLGYLP